MRISILLLTLIASSNSFALGDFIRFENMFKKTDFSVNQLLANDPYALACKNDGEQLVLIIARSQVSKEPQLYSTLNWTSNKFEENFQYVMSGKAARGGIEFADEESLARYFYNTQTSSLIYTYDGEKSGQTSCGRLSTLVNAPIVQ